MDLFEALLTLDAVLFILVAIILVGLTTDRAKLHKLILAWKKRK